MNCNSCHVELMPVFESLMRRREDFPQYEDALVINLRGGYGMFFDNLGISGESSNDERFVICKNCAKKLFNENPWLITPEIAEILETE